MKSHEMRIENQSGDAVVAVAEGQNGKSNEWTNRQYSFWKTTADRTRTMHYIAMTAVATFRMEIDWILMQT